MSTHKLKIKLALWRKLIKELKNRGMGRRETGAFLLGKRKENKITTFICYDDLDPHAFDSGIIIFNGDGFIPLWSYCSQKGLQVLADVHTHPGPWTSQSPSDMQHPMIAQRGHIALIVPNFATIRNQMLNGVGIHEFLGGQKWKSWKEDEEVFKLLK